MRGTDRYELAVTQGGTTLKHTKDTVCLGALRPIEPLVRGALVPRLQERLVKIGRELEERPNP